MRPEDVSDELVEIAEVACAAATKTILTLYPGQCIEDHVRAALAAVIPAIRNEALERAAVVADKDLADAQTDMAMAGDSDPTGFQQSEGAAHASERIAAAIRAMKEPTP